MSETRLAVMLFLGAILCFGGAACPDPTIDCWYVSAETQRLGEPWFVIKGRHLSRYANDIYGPYFQKEEQARSFIVENNLKLCGQNK